MALAPPNFYLPAIVAGCDAEEAAEEEHGRTSLSNWLLHSMEVRGGSLTSSRTVARTSATQL